MENSKMLPPSKRFKMENSVPVHHNGLETPKTGGTAVTSVTPLKSCSVSVAPLVIPEGTRLLTVSADSSSSSQAPPPDTPMEVTPGEDHDVHQEQASSSTDIGPRVTEPEKALGSGPSDPTDTKSSEPAPTPGSVIKPESSLIQTLSPSHPESGPSEAKEVQEGEEIYIQTEGLTVQLAEPGSDGIVIVNGPDGTTMHIQTPEGVPLEAVQALLGIEASDGAKAPH